MDAQSGLAVPELSASIPTELELDVKEMNLAERISDTNELLDELLDHYSAKNAALMQRFNKTFHTHIKDVDQIDKPIRPVPRLHRAPSAGFLQHINEIRAKRLRLGFLMHRRLGMNSQNRLVIPEQSASMRRTERRAEGKSASDRVAAIPELLDEILAPLPVREIFVLQRVNKTFQSRIRGNTRTARRLHLFAREGGTANIDPQFYPVSSIHYDWLGPRLLHQTPRLKLFTISSTAVQTGPESRKDTFISQPPIQVMTVFEGEYSGFASEYLQTLACSAGITLGSIYEMVKTMLLAPGRAEVVCVYYRARNNRIEVEFWKKSTLEDGAKMATSESTSSFRFRCRDNPGEAQMWERVFLIMNRSLKT